MSEACPLDVTTVAPTPDINVTRLEQPAKGTLGKGEGESYLSVERSRPEASMRQDSQPRGLGL